MLKIFTLCSNNYLALANTLRLSIQQFHPDLKLTIGLVDKKSPKIDYDNEFEYCEFLEVNEIGINNLESLIAKYNIVEFNTAVKAFYFKYFFDSGYNEVIYLDPDIKIYYSLESVFNSFHKYDFLLTPHLTQAIVDHIPEKEQIVLNVGSYNLGFLGVKKTHQGETFVDYLMNRMTDKCYIDFCKGLFVDQIWANQIPSYFEKVGILKDPGLNMAYWNFSERKLNKIDNIYYVNEIFPLKFFHFSRYSPNKPDELCRVLKYSFEERPDLTDIYNEYRKELIENNFNNLRSIKPALAFNPNHVDFDKKPPSLKKKIGKKLLKFNQAIIKKLFGV
jgi:hypothetical protein